MKRSLGHQIEANSKSEYATGEDFRRLFTEHVNRLYLLSFLLTANHETAEQCFLTGLDECVTGSGVFKEWARNWARRIIIRNAIRLIAPQVNPARTAPSALHSSGKIDFPTMSLQDAQFEDVLALGDFERFVYVLSVLERWSDQDSATLLDVPLQDVRDARTRAFQLIASYRRGIAVPTNDLSDVLLNQEK